MDPHWEGHGFRPDRSRLLGQRRWQSTLLSKKPTFHKAYRRQCGLPTGKASPGTANQTRSDSWLTFVCRSSKSTTTTKYRVRPTEERVVKTEDRREDQDENRSIRGRRGKAKDRKSRSTEKRAEIDTLKKERHFKKSEISLTLMADSAADILLQRTADVQKTICQNFWKFLVYYKKNNLNLM